MDGIPRTVPNLQNGWVSELIHAAYVGKELANAGLWLERGIKYLQDGAQSLARRVCRTRREAMDIKILGPSCANCLKLEMLVMRTLSELGIRIARAERISMPREMERLMTGDPPGLVINGQLVWSGGKELPMKAQITEWIREATPAPA